MPLDWQDFLDLINPGEPVTAGVTNRPIRTLDNNVRFLWEFIQGMRLGSAVYAFRVPIAPGLVIGDAVYFNTTTSQFEPAVTGVSPISGPNGAVQLAESGQVWGILARDRGAGLGDILLYGYVELDITGALAPGETLQAGVYRLTNAHPGKLTRARMPITVNVLRHDGTNKVFVCPQLTDLIDSHQHFRFSLKCLPAGTVIPPTPGNRHVISFPDATKMGWLPASHPIFGGTAPTDAVFGYNLSQHPDLAEVWPPVPLEHVYLEWNKGTDANVSGTGVPLGPQGLCIVDENGIWWMSDCYGDVPWPVNSTGADPLPDPPGVECPRSLHMELTLWFSKVFFATAPSWVRSLRSSDPRIRVLGPSGSVQSYGDLYLSLDAGATTANNENGHLVVKQVHAPTLTFKRGPVVEGVYTTNPDLTLSSTLSGIRNIGGTDYTVHQGLVRVELASSMAREMPVQLIRLDSVEEQFFQDTTYLGFPAGITSAIRCKIPITSFPGSPTIKLRLRFRILGRAPGTLPMLTITARRIPQPAAFLTDVLDLPTAADEFTVTCNTVATLTAANQYVEAESDLFDVEPGDLVFYTVRRNAGDGYAGEVGILAQKGILIAV